MQADETRKIRRMLFIRLFLLPFAVLLAACGTIAYFFEIHSSLQFKDELHRIGVDHRNLINPFLFILAAAGSGAAAAGYFMAADLAANLKLADLEKREIRTQLILAGKMVEIGEMSAGIAHEINNPLQVMMSELALIESITEELASDLQGRNTERLALLKESREVMGNQINRCGKITQGLLNFARKTDHTPAPVLLQTLMPQIVTMVDRRARVENVRIIQQIDERLPEIISDAGQLHQVFLNLLNNAVYACRGRAGAEIRIQARQEDDRLLVSVADNGCGIRPEDMEKVFRPFFTTKPVGQGTGLGLSAAFGIIKGLGGEITLTSKLNAGTEFHIRLPMMTRDGTRDARD